MANQDDSRQKPGAGSRENLPRMSFGDHLDELRKRLWRAILAVFAAMLLMMPFHDGVMGVIIQPYRFLWLRAFDGYVTELEAKVKALPDDPKVGAEDRQFLAFCIAEGDRIRAGNYERAFMLPVKTGFGVPYTLASTGGLADMWTFMMAAMVFALALASPVVIWQAWAFVAAGLYVKERRVFYRYFPFMVSLLGSGILFGYFVAVPYGLGFLIRMMRYDQVSAMLTVDQYFTLLFAMTTALGIVFQLPLVMVALQRVGLVRHATMLKHWRIIVLCIFVLAAVFTPPDPFSMMMMAAPTLVLYLLGIVLTWFGKKHESPELGAATPASTP